jgi:hypothetical protein
MHQLLNASLISEPLPRRILRCFFLFLACCMALSPARTVRAQVGSTLAQVNGSVRDESGGSVGKATITLRDVSTNPKFSNNSGSVRDLCSGVAEFTHNLVSMRRTHGWI